MKKLLLCTVILTLAMITARSQYKIFSSTKDSSAKDLPTQRAQVVFAELVGNGGLFSFNYDRRFSRSDKGFGMRVGIGYVPAIITGSMMSFPFTINYVLGKAPHYLELSTGFTSVVSIKKEYESGWMRSVMYGAAYRYQERSGVFTKVTLCYGTNTTTGQGSLIGGLAIGTKL